MVLAMSLTVNADLMAASLGASASLKSLASGLSLRTITVSPEACFTVTFAMRRFSMSSSCGSSQRLVVGSAMRFPDTNQLRASPGMRTKYSLTVGSALLGCSLPTSSLAMVLPPSSVISISLALLSLSVMSRTSISLYRDGFFVLGSRRVSSPTPNRSWRTWLMAAG